MGTLDDFVAAVVPGLDAVRERIATQHPEYRVWVDRAVPIGDIYPVFRLLATDGNDRHLYVTVDVDWWRRFNRNHPMLWVQVVEMEMEMLIEETARADV